MVGLAIGRMLVKPRANPQRDALKALVVGLALLSLAAVLPVVGGPVRVAAICLGAGALVRRLARAAGAVRSSEA